MEIKKCTKCGEDKELEEGFYRHKQSKGGFNTQCKSCVIKISTIRFENLTKDEIIKRKEYSSDYRKKNPDYGMNYYYDNIEKFINYRDENKEYFKNKGKERNKNKKEEIKIYNSTYAKNNPKYWSEWSKKKRNEDPLFRLKDVIRNSIYSAFRDKFFKKSKRTQDILGCLFEEFKSYIESLWEPWMNWDNYGNPKDGIFELNKTWDLDHITPLKIAETEEDIIRLNYYTNFQPLCSYTNRFIKRDNYEIK